MNIIVCASPLPRLARLHLSEKTEVMHLIIGVCVMTGIRSAT